MTLRELKQKRAKLIDDAQAIVDAAEKEGRSFTDEERGKIDSYTEQAKNMEGDIERLERLEGLTGDLVPEARQESMDPTIGMSQREVDQYSIVRLINGLYNHDARQSAAFEMEASDAVAQRMGRQASGRNVFIPYDFHLNAQVDLQRARAVRQQVYGSRAMVLGDPTLGGYTQDTTLMMSSFIDLLRNAMVLRRAGARVMGGLVGNFDIPKQTSGALYHMVGERQSVPDSQANIGQIKMRPKTGAGRTIFSRMLLNQSNMDVEHFVRAELATTDALGMERMCIYGAGGENQPLGISNIDGIGSVVIGENGGSPGWDVVIDLETLIASANADVSNMNYIVNAKTRGKFKKTPIVAGQAQMIWDVRSGNTPLNGYGALVTNLLLSNIEKGSSGATLSQMLFGNWADVIIGMWGVNEVLVDPYTLSDAGDVQVTSFNDFDVALRHEASISTCKDMATV